MAGGRGNTSFLHAGFEIWLFKMSHDIRNEVHEAEIPALPGQCGGTFF